VFCLTSGTFLVGDGTMQLLRELGEDRQVAAGVCAGSMAILMQTLNVAEYCSNSAARVVWSTGVTLHLILMLNFFARLGWRGPRWARRRSAALLGGSLPSVNDASKGAERLQLPQLPPSLAKLHREHWTEHVSPAYFVAPVGIVVAGDKNLPSPCSPFP
jgi:tellurite resistance protein TehA-like permease